MGGASAVACGCGPSDVRTAEGTGTRMMTIYMVNEKPDGSGAWLEPVSDRSELWSSAGGMFYVSRSSAEYAVKVFGGHVVEFTMGAKPEPRDGCPRCGSAYRFEEERDNRLCCVCVVDIGVHNAKPEPREPDGRLTYGNGMAIPCVFHHVLERLGWHEAGRGEVPVYVGEPPPAPPAEREPDAIMLCFDDGEPDWSAVAPEDDGAWPKLPRRKVYLDTPPRTLGWLDELGAALGWPKGGNFHDAIREVKRLKEDLDTALQNSRKLLDERKLALTEVSRLSKALDGEKRAYAGVFNELAATKHQLDELAKQEPVAWRSPFDCDNGWVWTSNSDVAEEWRRCGEVESLYAAPKPSERGLEIERRAKEAAIAEVAAYRNAGREVHGEKVDARTLNTCAACNAGPGMIGPAHTCGPADPLAHDLGIEAYAPADTPAMVEARRKIHDALSQLAGALSSLEPGRGAAEVQK